MEIFHSKPLFIEFLKEKRNKGLFIGFVPTMGALHHGHLSLIEASRQKSDITACSIYVNPTQFNNKSDLENYPRTLVKDLEMLNSSGCDVVFLPGNDDIYPNGMDERLHIELNGLDLPMEGTFRPGHFAGVVTVVHNLFSVVNPDFAFFGEKDFQQLSIIKQLVKETKKNIEIVGCTIVREKDGLAMSSRNQLLNTENRKAAPLLYQLLCEVKERSVEYPVEDLRQWVHQKMNKNPMFTLDYFEIVKESTLQPAGKVADQPSRAFIAAYLGKVRLIDNVSLNN